jgi:homospermidine synthase
MEFTRMMTFSNRILFVGFGGVARCALPILLRHIKVDPKRITIMDFDPDHAILKPWVDQGVTFVNNKVTEENMGSLLSQYLSAGDLLIDRHGTSTAKFSSGVTTAAFSTSIPRWNCGTRTGAEHKHPTGGRYWRHMKLRKMVAGWRRPGPA